MSKTILALLALTPFTALAQAVPATYKLLAPIGGMTTVTLSGYLQGILVVTIGMAGVLAVVMIVVCAIQMMGSPSVSQKSASKECITNAIFGLLLAVGSWLILNTINTQLLSNDLVLPDIGTTVLGTAAPSAPRAGTTFTWSPTAGTCPQRPGMITAMVPPTNCTGAGGGTCCGSVVSPISPRTPTPPRPPTAGFQNPFLPPPGGGTPVPGTPGAPTGAPPILPPALPGIGLGSTRFVISENAGSVLIRITRTGPTTGTLTLDYSTADITAIAGVDYTSVAGTITLLPGVATQTFSIPIIDNLTVGVPKRFSVLVNNPSAGTSLNVSSATVVINDNESLRAGGAIDTIAPIVTLINPANGFTTSVTSIPVDFTVVEGTQLRSVVLKVVESTFGLLVFTKSICNPSTNPCLPLGFTGTAVAGLGSFLSSGNFTVSITACDAKANCATQSVVGQYAKNCVPGDPRCNSDMLALQNCLGKAISGACARADLNLDGVINNADMLLLKNAQAFDINLDGIVDTKTLTTNFNDTCFFQTTQDPLLPCGTRVFGNITLSALDKVTLGNIYTSAKTSPQTLSIAQFSAGLCAQYGCSAPGGGLGGTSQLSIYGEMAIATLTKYDFNNDGIVDGTPGGADMAFLQACIGNPAGVGCARADINLDGFVTSGDMNFLTNANFAWGNTASTLSNLERLFWTGEFQPEAGILNVCQGAELILLCKKADLNADGVINAADTALLAGANIYDINNDGLVIYRPPTIAIPVSRTIAGTVSTKFVIGDLISTNTSLIVRQNAGDASQFLGVIPKGALGTVVGGPIFADGNWWWRVSYNGTFTGWSIETSIAKGVPPVVTPPPLPPVPPTTTLLSTKFANNERVGAVENLNVRATPALGGTFIGLIPANTTQGNIISAPVFADGYWWWQVRWDSGIVGWSVENWLKEFTPPVAPIITAPTNNAFVATTAVVVTGTAPTSEAGGLVTVYSGTTVLGTTVIPTTGTWTLTINFTDGTQSITATIRDQSQNLGPATSPRTFTVDTVAPSLPLVTSPVGTVNTSSFTLSGTAEAGSTVTIYSGSIAGLVLGTVVASGAGTWALPLASLPDALYTFVITARDRAGNTSGATTVTITVDAPPGAPTITAPALGYATASPTVIISGTGRLAGDTIRIYEGAVVSAITTVRAGLTWSVTLPALPDGLHTVTAREVDAGANESIASNSTNFIIDTIPPIAPTITQPTTGTTTATAVVTIGATASALGNTIELYINGILISSSLVMNAGPSWVFTGTMPVPGVYTAVVLEIDTVGNRSLRSTPVTFTTP